MNSATTASSDRLEWWVQSGVLRWLAPLLVLIIAIIGGMLRGLPIALLVLAGGVLILSITLLWNSLQALTGESPVTLEEALNLGAPSAEEEQKRALLRALKDLEYEHSVGKIDEEDYAALRTRYRAEAKTLLRSLDKGLAPNREHAEKLLEKRLAEAKLDKKRSKRPDTRRKTAVASAPEPELSTEQRPEEAELQTPATRPQPTRRCAGCETRNDLDARFCKGCGAAMAAADQTLCSTCPTVYESSRAACPECGVPREDA